MENLDFKYSTPDYFSEIEAMRIVEKAKFKEECYILCSLLWITGARISEIMMIEVSDIDFVKKRLKIRTLRRKTIVFRYLPIPDYLLEEVKSYILKKRLDDDDKILNFTQRTAFNYFRKACVLADIEDNRAHPSSFRHSYAMKYINDGVKLTKINERLGNRDIKKTVKLYIDYTRQEFCDSSTQYQL